MSTSAMLLLALKMAAAGGLVVGCAWIAERTGPLLAAMILTLPISVGPVYVFLALEHPPAFLAQAALGSVAANMGNAAFCYAYVHLAQRRGIAVCTAAGLCAWAVAVWVLRWMAPPFAVVMVLNVLVFAALHRSVRGYLAARPPAAAPKPWFVMPARAAAVAALAGTVSTLSAYLGPGWSGLLASVPVVLLSLVLMLHRSMGGPATAAIVGNGALGLLGLGLGLGSIHATAVPLGSWPALAIALLICVGWNSLLLLRVWRARRAPP